jgi:ABC-type microcin C transport system duplicated ATPase subunit YejF
VFQNPFDALNPRFTIYRAVAEPLLNAGIDKAEHADRVASAFRASTCPTSSAISSATRTS